MKYTNLKYAPYLVEHVRRYLVEKYGEKAVYEDGLTVTLPSSTRLAKAAGKSLKDGLALIDKRIGYRGPLQHLDSAEVENFERRANQTDRAQGALPDADTGWAPGSAGCHARCRYPKRRGVIRARRTLSGGRDQRG